MKKDKNTEIVLLQLILFIIPFLFGGFYEFASYIIGVILTIYLIGLCTYNRKIIIRKNPSLIAILGIVVLYLITSIYAVDRGIAILGFFKLLPIPIFLLILMQFERKDIDRLFIVIPYSGLTMLIFSALSYGTEGLEEYFYKAGRLGGFFQYSNTFALYLLLGMVVLLFKKKVNKIDASILIMLGGGILLTGSRAIFVLTVISLIIFSIKKKEYRKFISLVLCISLILGGVYAYLTGDFQNIGRFLTISPNSSTLLGRILYYIDGLKVLVSKPYGLGYMGYYYLQPEIQSGVYSTRFIHNDFLQIALDIGIGGLVLFIFIIVNSLKSKNISNMKKYMLVLICLASLVDFHLQYLCIFLIFTMLLDIEAGNEINISYKCINSVLVVALIALSYFSYALMEEYLGNYIKANKLYKYNTNVNINLLLDSKSQDEAEELANKIIKQNSKCYIAYDALAVSCANNKDYDLMVEYKQKSLEICRYEVSEYQDYVKLLQRAVEYYNDEGKTEEANKYINYMKKVPEQLKNIKNETSSIAYRINDKPKFEMNEETLEIINKY